MRERQMFKLAVALVMVCGSAAAYVVGYHVEPVKALWSGQTRTIWGQDFVSQGLTINFDELDSASGAYCELFAGSRGGGGAYHLSVLTNPGGTEIASANAGGDVDHEWVKFKLSVLRPDSIVKGKKLTFKFTRSGGDSIQFYYDSTDKYKYGCLTAPPLAYWTGDLACRVYGRMDTVGTIPWGATCFLPDNQADWGTWADSMEVSGAPGAHSTSDGTRSRRTPARSTSASWMTTSSMSQTAPTSTPWPCSSGHRSGPARVSTWLTPLAFTSWTRQCSRPLVAWIARPTPIRGCNTLRHY